MDTTASIKSVKLSVVFWLSAKRSKLLSVINISWNKPLSCLCITTACLRAQRINTPIYSRVGPHCLSLLMNQTHVIPKNVKGPENSKKSHGKKSISEKFLNWKRLLGRINDYRYMEVSVNIQVCTRKGWNDYIIKYHWELEWRRVSKEQWRGYLRTGRQSCDVSKTLKRAPMTCLWPVSPMRRGASALTHWILGEWNGHNQCQTHKNCVTNWPHLHTHPLLTVTTIWTEGKGHWGNWSFLFFFQSTIHLIQQIHYT